MNFSTELDPLVGGRNQIKSGSAFRAQGMVQINHFHCTPALSVS